MTQHRGARARAQTVMMLGLTYDHADFLIKESRARGVGISAVAREILDAEIRRRTRKSQGAVTSRRTRDKPVVGS